MTPDDLAALRRAVRSLEHPDLAARLTNMVGKPIELIGHVLPASASHAIATATSKGLVVALKVALGTMQRTPHAGSQLLHKALATTSGAAGGGRFTFEYPFKPYGDHSADYWACDVDPGCAHIEANEIGGE